MEWRLHIIFLVTFFYTTSSEPDTLKSTTITDNETNNNFVNALNEFGHQIMIRMMNKKKDDNIVISPTGINGLLAMTLLGSVGNTYDELAMALGFSQDILINRMHHAQFGKLLKSLNSSDSDSQTLYANAIFVDVNTHLRDLYRSYLHDVYNGETLGVDFEHKVDVKNIINNWVKVHTNDKIENFLREPLPESTKAVLVSALYFRGQWAQPFYPEMTSKWAFQRPSGEVLADFMINYGQFGHIYSTEDHFQMIALPYNDSITTMYIIKPTFPKRTSLSELMNQINYTKIDKLISKMTMQDCVIRIPKLDLQSNMELEDALKTLGIHSMFMPGGANFALMVDSKTVNKTEVGTNLTVNNVVEDKKLKDMVNGLPNPGIHVDSVIHKVKITINEYGTEAAAVASGFLKRSAFSFYAETPFYMFIRNEKTKLVTFSAVIFDPTVTK